MPIPAYVEGDLRIQFLSPTVVRIEQKGPKGFEDRPTFTAVGREWPGTAFKKQGTNLVAGGYTVVLPAERVGIKGIRVVSGGQTIYTVGTLPKTSWLPAPGKTGPVWPMADSPRLIPPKGGALPSNLGGEFGATSGYDTGNDAPDLYLFITKNPSVLRRDYLKLTGPIPLVPRFALGYWDSRWYPYTDKMALASIDEYHRRGLPLDLFVCDTDWRVGASKGYGVDKKLFPNMQGFLSAAHAKGVRVMFNDHPEPQAPKALDPQETVYRWNGLTDLMRQGLDVWWYDRNWSTSLREPMPGIPKEAWGASVFHDVTQAFRPAQRPLIMANVDGIDNGIRNRPPHPSFHRYPVPWTGDTGATWGYLRRAVENGVDEGVLGMLPYVHEDAGGHNQGNPPPELYTRFIQYCALSPLLRIHCTAGLTRYPWAFGPKAEEASVEAIRFRYRLIPTLYSAVHRAAEDGTPILRRPDLEWPSLPEAASNRQYLLGDDLLISPITSSDALDMMPLKAKFKGEYFLGTELAGKAVMERQDPAIDFDWGGDSPIPWKKDEFSVRWTTRIGPMPHTMDYQFATSTDDGVRLWIGDQKIIDQWKPLDSAMNTAKIRLEEGKSYDVKMEYFEGSGGANAHLLWGGSEPPRSTPSEWTFWAPPGNWIDPWTGNRIVGPCNVSMPRAFRRVPMLVRDGAVLFLGDDHVRNADEQLKKPITIEAFPGPVTTRKIIEDDGITVNAPKTTRQVTASRTANAVAVKLGASTQDRDLIVRIHLRAGETPAKVMLGSTPTAYRLEKAGKAAEGLGTIFSARGGSVVEIKLPKWPAGFTTSVNVQLRPKG